METYQRSRPTVFGNGLMPNFELGVPGFHIMLLAHHLLKVPKICPLPVSTFPGRKEILNKICDYFDSEHKSQHVFVLHGLGGAGKSQLAFKFLEDSKTVNQYDFLKGPMNF